MRIAYVSAGAGGMLCGSCLHDNTLAAAIKRMGHDIALIPTYTPIRTDEESVSLSQVFYGAVNVYLQNRSALFRHTPRLLDRLLDHPALLSWASRRGSATRAADLGDLTLSVLRGEEGHQRKELDRLASWLGDSFRPEIMHLTNSMFLGLAAALKRQTGAPIVCSVQGEDLFIEAMVDPFRVQAIDLLRLKAADADAFIAPSRYYAGKMSELLAVGAEKMHVVELGVSLEGYAEARAARPANRFVVGYLARVCPEKGFHLLAEGFRHLAEKAGRDAVLLRAAGYLGPEDRSYFEEVRQRLDSWGLTGSFEYLGEVDRAAKIRFLSSLDLLCVPTIYREPKGLFFLEALAAGVPAALPRHGSFPELVERTGGGVLFEPGSPSALAAALGELMDKPVRRRALGEAGRLAVHRLYSDDVMARETLKVYLAALSGAAVR